MNAMSLVELVVSICLVSDPQICRERHFCFAEDGLLAQRIVRAQLYPADWVSRNAQRSVVRWNRGYVDRRERHV
jgi:hypothetical protein